MSKFKLGDKVKIPSKNDGLIYYVSDENPPERFGKNKVTVRNDTHEDGAIRAFILDVEEVTLV